MCGNALVLSVGFCVRIKVHRLLTPPFAAISFRNEAPDVRGYDAMVIVARTNATCGVAKGK